MPGSYAFLDHTADRRLKITGSDLETLFKMGLDGLGCLLTSTADVEYGDAVKRSIQVTAPDLTILLVDFLSEVLTYTHIDKAIYEEVEFDYLESKKLNAYIHGRRVNGFEEEIKAVTYHEAHVSRNREGNWESMIIFDI